MPVRPLTREQMFLLPPSLEDMVPIDHPVRLVEAFMTELTPADWEAMGIHREGERMGAPGYHAYMLLSVWLCGFMCGIRSSRGLERACRELAPFWWLTGRQFPDHNTLWRFYRDHREGMRILFKRSVQIAVEMNLVDVVLQALDGTKVKGNATRDRTYDEAGLDRLMGRLDETIRDLEAQCEADESTARPELPPELCDARRLREEVQEALKRVRAKDGPKRINLTDPDAQLMKGRQGLVAGYNAQAMVSSVKAEHEGGLVITAADVTNAADDHEQLVPMIEQAEENTGEAADTSTADGSYHSGKNLQECEERGYHVLMPEAQRKAMRNPYHKDHFEYDAERDEYICPQGQRLVHSGVKRRKDRPESRVYRGCAKVCRECLAFGRCTKDRRHGRAIEIGPYEKELRAHRVLMAQDESQELYRLRKQMVEPVFGTMKEVQGARRFLLRGLDNVRAEWLLLATAFNLRTLWRLWARSQATWGLAA